MPELDPPDADDQEKPATPGTPDTPNTFDWKPILQVLAVVAGGAVWVQLVGSLDMWARFNNIGVAHTSTVSLLPRDLLFATGVRALTLPVLAGISALGALVACHARQERRTSRKVPRNAAGRAPPGLLLIFVVIALGACALVFISPLQVGVQVGLVSLVVVGTWAIYSVIVYCTSEFGPAALALLAGTALLGGVLGFVLQYFAPAKLDVAVALRKDGQPISGYYIGRTSDAIYLLTTTPRGGKPDPPLYVAEDECDQEQITTPRGKCYVEQVVGVHTSDVVKFAIGPRSVTVDAKGYNTAGALADTLLQMDPPPRPSAGGS